MELLCNTLRVCNRAELKIGSLFLPKKSGPPILLLLFLLITATSYYVQSDQITLFYVAENTQYIGT